MILESGNKCTTVSAANFESGCCPCPAEGLNYEVNDVDFDKVPETKPS